VELASPWTLREFFIQRKRWLWGDVHAITHRGVLPLSRAVVLASAYVVNTAVMLFSVAGIAMRLDGALPPASPVYDVAKLALLTWLVLFFAVGWIGASGRVDGRNADSRLLNALMAVVSPRCPAWLSLRG
jgi:hypothetical protein